MNSFEIRWRWVATNAENACVGLSGVPSATAGRGLSRNAARNCAVRSPWGGAGMLAQPTPGVEFVREQPCLCCSLEPVSAQLLASASRCIPRYRATSAGAEPHLGPADSQRLALPPEEGRPPPASPLRSRALPPAASAGCSMPDSFALGHVSILVNRRLSGQDPALSAPCFVTSFFPFLS